MGFADEHVTLEDMEMED